jgi:hypothetical protein
VSTSRSRTVLASPGIFPPNEKCGHGGESAAIAKRG